MKGGSVLSNHNAGPLLINEQKFLRYYIRVDQAMTTDIVKHREMNRAVMSTAQGTLFTRLPKTGGALALPGPGGDERAWLLRQVQASAAEKDGLSRTMKTTIAMLRHAYQMIEDAEALIMRQESRIAQLEALATTDELTGLTNRRGFFDAFMAELDRCARGVSQGGLLVMIDLDNFKTINDTFGHMAGDACLRLVARSLQGEVRAMDVAARLGGDEFVLLLSNTTKQSAAARAQDIAWRLNHLALAWYGEEIPIQASLGIKDYKRGDRPDSIFNAADMALYDRKRKRQEQTVSPGCPDI